MSAPARTIWLETDWLPHSESQRTPLLCPAQIIDLTAGRRWGKTDLGMSWLTGVHPDAGPGNNGAVWVAGSRNVYAAPTYEPNCAEFYDRLLSSLSGLIKVKNDSERWIKLRHNDAELKCISLEKYELHRGIQYDRLVIDEKGTTAAKAWYNVLAPVLADVPERCIRRVLRQGSARGKRHWTYREHLASLKSPGGITGRAAFVFPTWARPGTERWVEDVRTSAVPTNVFRQEIGAEFLDEVTAYFQKIGYTGADPPGPDSGARYTAGIDLAHAVDMTVVVVLRARPLPMIPVGLLRFGVAPWGITKARVVEFLRAWDVSEALLDATPGGSPGDVTVEAFRPEWTRIKGFDSRAFAGAGREDMLKNLALQLEQDALLLPGTDQVPHFPDITRELTGFEYEILSSGRARASAGVDADGERLQDDCVIALALAAYAAREITDPYGSRKYY